MVTSVYICCTQTIPLNLSCACDCCQQRTGGASVWLECVGMFECLCHEHHSYFNHSSIVVCFIAPNIFFLIDDDSVLALVMLISLIRTVPIQPLSTLRVRFYKTVP